MYFDPRYLIFLGPALLLAFYAQMKVKSAYAKYTQVANQRRLTGLDAARIILGPEGLNDVSIEGLPGQLTDHYDPRTKKLRLSAGVANQPSVASLAIVAHEIGHALQDSHNYAPLKLRGAIVPAVQVSGWVAPILFLIGYLLGATSLAWLGVILFALGAVFALVTLPVEFNASHRGLRLLQTYQLADGAELRGAKAVLDAAALTYVAALAQTLATLLYYVTLLTGSRRRS
ncbi:MAG: zinc metallopeptidase [Anaerolineae bacterium CG2_30_64_16]|nr:MAG: zinc metallopeptidase [Anaerolineae bacterium CG2_30_64_16]